MLPDAASPRPTTLFEPPTVAGPPVEVLPDAVHVPQWLDLPAQQRLATAFRAWAQPPAGLRHPRMPTGHLMTVQSVCLGWHWQPYAYTRTADDTDGAPVKPLPPDVFALGRDAVAAAYGDAGGTHRTRSSPTSTPPAPSSACTATARSRPTRRS